MMLSKKNSDTLENFSEKLEIEGRSLWQDARRRFISNRAAVTSLIVLAFIALFVAFAPLLSQFAYADTDWNMMSAAPDLLPTTISAPILQAVICWFVLLSVAVFH